MRRTALLSLIDGKPCVTSVKIIFFGKNFPPNFTPLKTDLFVKHQKTLMLIEDYSYSSGTFFTQKRLSSVLFFPPSCCVNLLILQGDWETARNKSGSKERNNSVLRVLRGASSREGGRWGGGGLRQRDGWYYLLFTIYYLLFTPLCVLFLEFIMLARLCHLHFC